MSVRISFDKKFLESEILHPECARWGDPKEIPPPKPIDQLLRDALINPIGSTSFT